MRSRVSTFRALVGVLVLALMATTSAFGAGFGIFEQGSKAMGMAGAFTAQADDPSALFHNVGGLAFFDESDYLAGFTFIASSQADFTGLSPFPGDGVTAQQDSLAKFVPHFYWVRPLNEKLKFGFAVNAPFGLATNWNADEFEGRYISVKGALEAIDISPNIGIKLSENFGIGVGAILRGSSIELRRRQPAINPFTAQVADVADVLLESDVDTGLGWTVGMLYKSPSRFSVGLSYRSNVDIDYGGDARFTQLRTGFAEFDGLVATALPFGTDLPIATSIEFPDFASLGVAFDVTSNVLVEVDLNYAGWSSVDQIVVDFNGALPNLVLRQLWDDSNNYRLGVRWSRAVSEWRFGYVFDETPQPDADVGPLLSDSDRNGFTVGYGRQGNRFSYDVAFMYLPFDERTTRVNQDDFNGTYEFTGWLFGLTVGW